MPHEPNQGGIVQTEQGDCYFLTTSETRVLKLIAEDRTSKEIAELLKITATTSARSSTFTARTVC